MSDELVGVVVVTGGRGYDDGWRGVLRMLGKELHTA